jgi:putative transposase
MARPMRIEFPGAFYHVISKGNERKDIFDDDYDKKKFMDILLQCKERYGVKVHAYVLMDNHYHILLETPNGNLINSMHFINGTYAKYFNKKHSRVGHLFQGRYTAILIDKDTYLQEVVRYIHLNPYWARICHLPEEFVWSSYREYVQKPLEYVADTKDVLFMFGNTYDMAKKSFVEHTMLGMSKNLKDLRDELYFDFVIGGGTFVTKVKRMRDNTKADKEALEPRSVKIMGDEEKLKMILQEVNKVYNIDERSLIGERGIKNPARRAAMYLIYNKTGLKVRQIADMFGGMHYSTVPQTVKRIEKSEKEMKNIKKLMQML